MESMNDTVYVVQSGERFEGAAITRLFRSQDSAMKFAAELRAVGEGEWEDCIDDFILGRDFGYWVRDCDWIHVFMTDIEK